MVTTVACCPGQVYSRGGADPTQSTHRGGVLATKCRPSAHNQRKPNLLGRFRSVRPISTTPFFDRQPVPWTTTLEYEWPSASTEVYDRASPGGVYDHLPAYRMCNRLATDPYRLCGDEPGRKTQCGSVRGSCAKSRMPESNRESYSFQKSRLLGSRPVLFER
jgi:hypothetical protein